MYHCENTISKSEMEKYGNHDGPCKNEKASAVWVSGKEADEPVRAFQ